MSKFLLYAVPAILVLYCLIDALQTRRGEERNLPKWLWLIVILLVPVLGAIAWLVAGRPARPESAAGDGPRRRRGVPAAPDDDPAFLRKLDDDAWTKRMRQRREGGGGMATEPTVEPSTESVDPEDS